MRRDMDQHRIGVYVDAASEAVGLLIPAEYRQGVVENLQAILVQSAGLMALELDPTEEAAPVFFP